MRKSRIRKPRDKHYGFVFTNYRFDTVSAELEQLKPYCVYAVAGLEACPLTGKLHIQGYFYLKEPKSRGKARRYLKDVHIEPARECPEKNFLYCTKGNNYLTVGSISDAIIGWKNTSH